MKEKFTNKYLKHIHLLLKLSANVAACSGKYHLCFPFHPLLWQGHSLKKKRKTYPVLKLLYKFCTPERGGNHYLASHGLTISSGTPVPHPPMGLPGRNQAPHLQEERELAHDHTVDMLGTLLRNTSSAKRHEIITIWKANKLSHLYKNDTAYLVWWVRSCIEGSPLPSSSMLWPQGYKAIKY